NNNILVASGGVFQITTPANARTALGLGGLAILSIADLPDNSSITISGGGKLQVSAVAPARNIIAGLHVASPRSSSLTLSAGGGSDSTNAVTMRLGSAMTKTPLGTATGWVQGNNQRGRASGISISSNTTLHIFLIAKADGTTDCGLDTSITAANLLA